MAMPVWLKEKLLLKTVLKKELASLAGCKQDQLPPLLFTEHHQAHAASAFFPSPFERSAVLCMDGVGEWATTSVWMGENHKLTPQWEIDFPHSLGMLYSAFTYYTGFKVNSGEYKLMGLAPYGTPKYVDLIYDNLLDLKEDGTFRLNMQYFNYATGLTMTNRKFDEPFWRAAEKTESGSHTEGHGHRQLHSASYGRNRAAPWTHGAQRIEYGQSVPRGRRGPELRRQWPDCLREGPFKDIWIQPAAGDAGGAVGAALRSGTRYLAKPKTEKRHGYHAGLLSGAAFY
jgi:carbamoyltransferase